MTISELVKKGLEKDSILQQIRNENLYPDNNGTRNHIFDLTVDYPVIEAPEVFQDELQAIINSTRSGLHRYMENAGYVDTRTAIATRLNRETGLKFTYGHVIMTSGASGAINIALKALLNPGEEVILLAPLCPDYETYVENHSGICKIVPSDQNFNPDMDALEAAITPRTKALIINSPNNPAGVIYDEAVLKQISDIVTQTSARLSIRIYIVSDDTYRRFYYGRTEQPWIVNHYPHTILAYSFSKILSIPGARIGYAAVHPDCDEAMTVVGGMIHANRTLGFVNAPSLMQKAVGNLLDYKLDTGDYSEKRDLLLITLPGWDTR